MSDDIEFNVSKCSARLSKVVGRKQAILDNLVLSDSNYFVPLKTGALQKSGIINTVLGSGLVQWKTPYARKMYYLTIGENTTFRKNPNATPKWVETAKTRFMKKWEKAVQVE